MVLWPKNSELYQLISAFTLEIRRKKRETPHGIGFIAAKKTYRVFEGFEFERVREKFGGSLKFDSDRFVCPYPNVCWDGE